MIMKQSNAAVAAAAAAVYFELAKFWGFVDRRPEEKMIADSSTA